MSSLDIPQVAMKDSITAQKLAAHWPLGRRDRDVINGLAGRALQPLRTGTDLFTQVTALVGEAEQDRSERYRYRIASTEP